MVLSLLSLSKPKTSSKICSFEKTCPLFLARNSQISYSAFVITCLMVTHNMHQALTLGNRTLMMNAGNIVLDVVGEERAAMSVDDLLEQFALRAGKALDNDRILFSKVETQE